MILNLATGSSAMNTVSNADDLGMDFYLEQCTKNEAYFCKVFEKLGWKNCEDWLAECREECFNSPVFYWTFFMGLHDDLALATKYKRSNRRLALEKLAKERIERITRNFRKNRSYVEAL